MDEEKSLDFIDGKNKSYPIHFAEEPSIQRNTLKNYTRMKFKGLNEYTINHESIIRCN